VIAERAEASAQVHLGTPLIICPISTTCANENTCGLSATLTLPDWIMEGLLVTCPQPVERATTRFRGWFLADRPRISLFRSQRLHWIDPRRPPCRNEAGE